MKKIAVALVSVCVLTGCTVSSIYSNEDKIISGTNTFNLSEEEQTIEGQKFIAEVQFGGMDTIWICEAGADYEVDIDYSLDLSEGKAKLVLISADGTIADIVESEFEEEDTSEKIGTMTLSLKKGENRIKLIAIDKSEVSFEIEIEDGEFYKLGM